MDTLNEIVGIVILGVAAYAAGAYHIKSKLEDEVICLKIPKKK